MLPTQFPVFRKCRRDQLKHNIRKQANPVCGIFYKTTGYILPKVNFLKMKEKRKRKEWEGPGRHRGTDLDKK